MAFSRIRTCSGGAWSSATRTLRDSRPSSSRSSGPRNADSPMSRTLRSIPPVALALLAGCAQMPAPPAPLAEAPVSRPSAVEARKSEVIANHRKLAESAKKDGDLATAAMEWQIIVLLAPDNDGYRREWAAVRAAIPVQVKEQLQAGSAAMGAGDPDRAHRARPRAWDR